MARTRTTAHPRVSSGIISPASIEGVVFNEEKQKNERAEILELLKVDESLRVPGESSDDPKIQEKINMREADLLTPTHLVCREIEFSFPTLTTNDKSRLRLVKSPQVCLSKTGSSAEIIEAYRKRFPEDKEYESLTIQDMRSQISQFEVPASEVVSEPMVVDSRVILNRFIHLGLNFKGIDMRNIIVAGGFISSLVQKEFSRSKTYRDFNDIDIFVYGLKTEAEATERADRFLTEYFKASRGETVIRTKGSVTINSAPKIQVILRLYSSASEVLHGFDLGSCAVGVTGDSEGNLKLVTTSLGKFCLETCSNIIIPSRCSSSYLERLGKYLDRGYSIIMPNYDITTPNVSNSHYLRLEVLSATGNAIIGYLVLPGLSNELQKQEEYDGLDGLDDDNQYTLRTLNLRSFKKWSGESRTPSFHMTLKMRKIVNPLASLQKKLPIYFDEYDLEGYVRNNVLSSKDDFSVKNVMEMSQVNLEEIVREYANSFSGDEGKAKWNAYIEALLKKQIDLALLKYQKLQKEYTIEWQTENPGSQLTGSFNPEFVTKKLFYGSAYIEIEE